MTWSEELVTSALSVDRLTDDVRAATMISLLDGLAVMAAAPALEPAVLPFTDLARASGAGPSALLAGGSAAPALAALANGALAHALDYEDTFDAAGLHPNAVAIPALLALAEAEEATLGALLTALAVGCDAACRIGLALPSDPAARGWYHPPMIAAAGAAVGAAHLLRLTVEQAIAAVSLTLVQFSLTDGLKRSPASDLRAVRDGFAARAAVDGALLARAGVTGTADPLGADGLIGLLCGAGPKGDAGAVRFLGREVSLKSWPCCRGTHPAIATALSLRAAGMTPVDLERAVFRLCPPDDMLFEPKTDRLRPRTAIMAKFSIPYTFAWTLHHGAPGLHSFRAEALADAAVLATADRVTMRDCAPDLRPEVTVTTRDRASARHWLAQPPTVLARDAGPADMSAKLAQCAALAHPGAAALLDALSGAADALKISALTGDLRGA